VEKLTDKLIEVKRKDGRIEVGTVVKDYRSFVEVAFLDGKEDIKRYNIIKVHD
jgi:hypothetical protein